MRRWYMSRRMEETKNKNNTPIHIYPVYDMMEAQVSKPYRSQIRTRMGARIISTRIIIRITLTAGLG
jgi:hypothetical protein